MDKKQWKRVNQIVDTALELKGKKRETYLDQQCEGNDELRSKVTQLLKSIEESANKQFLENTEAYPRHLAADVTSVSGKNPNPGSSLIGETIGKYKILDLIGHGGMGSVFLTERVDGAYDKRVALKLMRRGMDTPSNLARFKRERNILANLDHPNIARLLDGGITEDGLPYLVMEHVDGIPLNEFCNRHKLSVHKRCSLFKTVCSAVEHAHQNAIIHRDLKPSNILVTEDGTVKVLDFGIAKLLDASSQYYQTSTGHRMLTLGYAAPEQLEHKRTTTGTDTYTLGIVLYQLLSGAPVFDLGDKDLAEIERMIRRQDPVKPSTQFSKLPASEQLEIASHRATTPDKLKKELQGDLDAIILKALRKSPEGRYGSAGNFLEDLDRLEHNMPIAARKGTFRYNTSKFVKRNKKELSVAAGFLLLIVGFGIFYTWQITKQRNQARLEAKKAQQVSDFLAEMFQADNPIYNPSDSLTVNDILQHGRERIGELDDQPAVQTTLFNVIGRSNIELGNFNKAESLLTKSLTMGYKVGPQSIEYGESLQNMGFLMARTGRFKKADSLYRKGLHILKKHYDNESLEVAQAYNNLGLAVTNEGKYPKADSLFQKALRIYHKKLPANDTEIANTLNNLGAALRYQGRYDSALVVFQKSLNIFRQNHSFYHPNISDGYNDLAIVYENMGSLQQADSLMEISLDIDRQLYKIPNPKIAQSLNNLGRVQGKMGHYQKSEDYLKQSLKMREEIFGKNSPELADLYNNLGRLYIETGQNDKARPMLKKALTIDKRQYGRNHPYVAGDLYNLGLIQFNDHRYKEAEKNFRESLSIFKKVLPPDHPRIAGTLNRIGEILLKEGKPKESEPLLRKALTIRKKKLDTGDWHIAESKILLGEALTSLQKYRAAETLIIDGFKTIRKTRGDSDQYTRKAFKALKELYYRWEKPEKADQYSLHS